MKLLALAVLVIVTGQSLSAGANNELVLQDVTENFLLPLNLLRTARMNTGGTKLEINKDHESAVENALNEKFEDTTQCKNSAQSLNPSDVRRLYLPFVRDVSLSAGLALPSLVLIYTFGASGVRSRFSLQLKGLFLSVTAEEYGTSTVQVTKLLQKELNNALKVLEKKPYTAETKFNPTESPFDTSHAQNAAYMMFASSTKVACAMTTNCGDTNYVLCMFEPKLEAESVGPFSAELYNSMLARKAAQVDLSALVEADYNTPLDPTSTALTDELLLGLNLLRTARMDTRGKELTKSATQEEVARLFFQRKFPKKEGCDASASAAKSAKLEGFFLEIQRDLTAEAQFPALLQEELEAALNKLGPEYVPVTKFDTDTSPFDTPSAQNAAYLMFPDSTEVGCAVANKCDNNKDYILCIFSPTLTEDESVPFPADLYKSMLARKEAAVDLSTLTKDDYNTSLDQTSGAGGGTGFSAGLLAFTVMSLLAF
ncbi:hypothetical protein Esti_005251 [Eimeria stiedai]